MNFFIVRGINYYWNYLFGSIYFNYNYVELNYDLCFMCLKKLYWNAVKKSTWLILLQKSIMNKVHKFIKKHILKGENEEDSEIKIDFL